MFLVVGLLLSMLFEIVARALLLQIGALPPVMLLVEMQTLVLVVMMMLLDVMLLHVVSYGAAVDGVFVLVHLCKC